MTNDSQYIQIVEEGNRLHSNIIKEVQEGERKMRAFCGMLPEDRLVKPPAPPELDLNACYIEPSTGAKLTHGHSKNLLWRYVNVLVCDTLTLTM